MSLIHIHFMGSSTSEKAKGIAMRIKSPALNRSQAKDAEVLNEGLPMEREPASSNDILDCVDGERGSRKQYHLY